MNFILQLLMKIKQKLSARIIFIHGLLNGNSDRRSNTPHQPPTTPDVSEN
jgi:hypothetical protein